MGSVSRPQESALLELRLVVQTSKRQYLGQSGTDASGGRPHLRSVETGDPTNLGLKWNRSICRRRSRLTLAPQSYCGLLEPVFAWRRSNQNLAGFDSTADTRETFCAIMPLVGVLGSLARWEMRGDCLCSRNLCIEIQKWKKSSPLI